MKYVFTRLMIFAVAAIYSIASPLWAEDASYRLQSGDEIVVSLVGLPDTRTNSMVDNDGFVSLPFVGRVQGKDLTLQDISDLVSTKLLTTTYLLTNLASGPRQIELAGVQVFVDISKFRPIFVGGDVLAPGEFEFQPGMTLRAAIARAGGIAAFAGVQLAPGQQIQFMERSSSLRATLLGLQLQDWRLQALLNGDKSPEDPEFPGLSGVAGASELLKIERDFLHSEFARIAGERLALEEQLAKERRASTLYGDVILSRSQLVAVDRTSKESSEKLFERGLTTEQSLTTRRRLFADSQSDLLTDQVNQSNAQFQVQRLGTELEILASLTQAALLAERRTVLVRINEVKAQLSVVDAATGVTSSLQNGDEAPVIIVHREGANLRLGAEISMDTVIEPGDVISVNGYLE